MTLEIKRAEEGFSGLALIRRRVKPDVYFEHPVGKRKPRRVVTPAYVDWRLLIGTLEISFRKGGAR